MVTKLVGADPDKFWFPALITIEGPYQWARRFARFTRAKAVDPSILCLDVKSRPTIWDLQQFVAAEFEQTFYDD